MSFIFLIIFFFIINEKRFFYFLFFFVFNLNKKLNQNKKREVRNFEYKLDSPSLSEWSSGWCWESFSEFSERDKPCVESKFDISSGCIDIPACNLIYNFFNIKLILSHCSGFFPSFVLWSIAFVVGIIKLRNPYLVKST